TASNSPGVLISCYMRSLISTRFWPRSQMDQHETASKFTCENHTPRTRMLDRLRNKPGLENWCYTTSSRTRPGLPTPTRCGTRQQPISVDRYPSLKIMINLLFVPARFQLPIHQR